MTSISSKRQSPGHYQTARVVNNVGFDKRNTRDTKVARYGIVAKKKEVRIVIIRLERHDSSACYQRV